MIIKWKVILNNKFYIENNVQDLDLDQETKNVNKIKIDDSLDI